MLRNTDEEGAYVGDSKKQEGKKMRKKKIVTSYRGDEKGNICK